MNAVRGAGAPRSAVGGLGAAGAHRVPHALTATGQTDPTSLLRGCSPQRRLHPTVLPLLVWEL